MQRAALDTISKALREAVWRVNCGDHRELGHAMIDMLQLPMISAT